MNPRAKPATGGPRLVGIVNITEDSYSDGGLYLSPERALAHARQLRADGADIVELGAAASHPSARRVTPEREQARLAPVLEALALEGIPTAVDSFAPLTQRFAMRHGVGYLNDIRGFPDPDIYPALAEAECRLIVMHSVQRGPATKVVTEAGVIRDAINDFFEKRLPALLAAGIPPPRLILDPGLGYFVGSNAEPSLAVLAHIRQLKARFGLPVLLSPSRKSFLRAVTGRDLAQVGPASLAAELHAASHGADYIRTHDVAALRDALTVLDAINRAR